MLSIQGLYDGKELKIFDAIQIDSPKKVIITFLDDPSEDISTQELHQIIDEGGAFDFLNDEQEDIYSDSDLKVKY
jgi:cobalamin biosynthesis Co2+ chelatase CbiK